MRRGLRSFCGLYESGGQAATAGEREKGGLKKATAEKGGLAPNVASQYHLTNIVTKWSKPCVL